MPEAPRLVWQTSLFEESGAPRVDHDFRGLVRHQLDATAWVDHVPGWLEHADEMFAWLLEAAPWQETEQELYGRTIATPRLVARWPYLPGEVDLPPVLEDIRAALVEQYRRPFDSVSANLYRDGRDSVAWHGDRIAREIAEPLVAIVSIGEPRRFLLRPKPGGRGVSPKRTAGGGLATVRLVLGRGELLVTGGTTQRAWEHSVPKVASAGPRMSLTFRHGLLPFQGPPAFQPTPDLGTL
jgi:alkylated DNA repair dioxygenase AlkB